MILNVDDVYKAFLYNNINITGIFHVGAHECEELLFYNSFGVKNEDIVWIDADTYTHKSFSNLFLESLLPRDTMLTYLGREKESQAIYPECGFVGYNLKHPEIQNFINDWEKLYSTDEIFNLLEWHDSAVLWHLSKKYIAEKNIKINDIGHGAGASGHHVFVNSKLGIYIDHFKGEKRKIARRSAKDDFKTIQPYWRN